MAQLTGIWPLARCMEEISHREYLMLVAWMGDQWNEPDRTDHYLMQIAAEIINSRPSKKGSRRKAKKINDMNIPFKSVDPVPSSGMTEQQLALSKSKWRAIAGMGRKKQ